MITRAIGRMQHGREEERDEEGNEDAEEEDITSDAGESGGFDILSPGWRRMLMSTQGRIVKTAVVRLHHIRVGATILPTGIVDQAT